MFGIDDSDGQKWLIQLRIRLSPLNAHKFHHNFEDTLTPMCNIHDGIDDSAHFLLHCRQCSTIRLDLFHNLSLLLKNLDANSLPINTLLNILIYGKANLSREINKNILLNTINFIRRSNRLWSKCALHLSPTPFLPPLPSHPPPLPLLKHIHIYGHQIWDPLGTVLVVSSCIIRNRVLKCSPHITTLNSYIAITHQTHTTSL